MTAILRNSYILSDVLGGYISVHGHTPPHCHLLARTAYVPKVYEVSVYYPDDVIPLIAPCEYNLNKILC